MVLRADSRVETLVGGPSPRCEVKGKTPLRYALPTFAALIAALTGCTAAVDSSGEALVVTSECVIEGRGRTVEGNRFRGRLEGQPDNTGVGRWVERFPGGRARVETVDFMECRLNGAIVGEAYGTASYQGSEYEFVLSIFDEGENGLFYEPDGASETVRLEAARRGCRRGRRGGGRRGAVDALRLPDIGAVAVPASVAVDSGSAHRARVSLTFKTADANRRRGRGPTVRCSYAGAGSSLDLVNCTRGVEAGDLLYAREVKLRVHGGRRGLGVSAGVDISPTRQVEVRDRYQFQLLDAGGNVVVGEDGRITAGDTLVTEL